MRTTLLCLAFAAFLSSCNNSGTMVKDKMDSSSSQTKLDLPYTASYSSNWNDNVSDEDLKTVMASYKAWESNDMAGLSKTMADTSDIDMNDGTHLHVSNADLMKRWSTFRDSLSSVKIKMDAWNKMYSTDKKEGYVVTWYDETDTYKTGKVDSASYHDINQVKNGKIVWYAQYKRPKK